MDWFGAYWSSVLTDTGLQDETPVGDCCRACDQGIEEGDQGVFVPSLREEGGFSEADPFHRHCFEFVMSHARAIFRAPMANAWLTGALVLGAYFSHAHNFRPWLNI